MKQNTEINIEMADDGSWVASSPDYPEWECKGTESFGAADIGGEGLRTVEWATGLPEVWSSI